MLTYWLFGLGFVFLITGAHVLIKGASHLGQKLRLSPMLIGLTIVAMGTSLPELIINVFASIEGKTDLAIGNVLGSNLANTLLILGVSALIFPMGINSGTPKRDIPLNIGVVLLLFLLANDWIRGSEANYLSWWDGLVLLVVFHFFLWYTYRSNRVDTEAQLDPATSLPLLRSLILIISGVAGLYLGGQWIVDGAIQISTDAGISESGVGLTLVALATSLPELVTSILAALKKQSSLAVGNALGSNLFNILFVLGLSSVIHPIAFDVSLNMEIGLALGATLFLLLFVWTGKGRKISRFEGMLLILGYVFFIYYSLTSH